MIRPLLIALALLPVLGLSQLDPNRVVATVNGEEIKASDYYRRMEWYRVDPRTPTASLPAGFLTIKQLITETLIAQMAKAKGVAPVKPEIDAAVQDAETNEPDLLSELKKEGRSETDLREQIVYNLTQFKLQTAGITVTDQEIDKHYASYPEEFTKPKQYHLKVIVVTDPKEETAVDQDLAAGKSFGEVAKAHSLHASKDHDGDYGMAPENAFAPATKQAIEAVKIGQTTHWIEDEKQSGTGAKVKFLVQDVIPAQKQPLDDTLRKSIRRKLMLDRGQVKNSVLKDLQDASVKAKIVINQPGFQALYDQILGRLKADSSK